jgi:hypothetical protein
VTDDRFDFGSLDPTADRPRFDGIVAAIAARAAPELARRRARTTPLAEVTRWTRPVLAAAALVLAVALATLSRVDAARAGTADPGTLAEAVGVPSSIAEAIHTDQVPAPTQLLFLFDESAGR